MTYISTCIADGALGLWVLGESSVGSPAADQAGNQNGTYTNTGAITLGQTGIGGGGGATAALFTSSGSGYVDIPDHAFQELDGGVFTLEAWVKTAAGSEMSIISAPNGSAMNFAIDSSAHLIGNMNGIGTLITSTSTISNDSAFHHVAWIRSGTNSTTQNQLYIDGTEGHSANLTNTIAGNLAWQIGRKAINGTNYFNGTMQFVAIYPTALSSGTISNHYSLGGSVVTSRSFYGRTG